MPRSSPDMPTYRPVADHALLVEFGTTISDDTHAAVLALDAALTAKPFDGYREAVPAFVNLLVTFDPALTDHAAVEDHLRALTIVQTIQTQTQREVLICYDNAPDLAEVALRTCLTEEAVIAAHLSGDYKVFLFGFAPGYAYLGGLPEALRLDRKPTPVRNIPAGSVIIAGSQCLVTTLTMPTGWWIIGRSPTRILTGNLERPFLFDVGDRVTFRRIPPDHAAIK